MSAPEYIVPATPENIRREVELKAEIDAAKELHAARQAEAELHMSTANRDGKPRHVVTGQKARGAS